MKTNIIGKFSSDVSTNLNKRPLKLGDLVKGRVINNDNGRITIKTADGGTITASFLSKETLEEGSIMSFIVNQIEDEQIYAELLKSQHIEEGIEGKMLNILDEIGVKPNDFNEETIKTLLKFWQPINKDKIEHINFIFKTIEDMKENRLESISSLLASDTDVLNTPVEVFNTIFSRLQKDELFELQMLLSDNNLLDTDKEIEIEKFLTNLSKQFSIEHDELKNIEQLIQKSIKAFTSMSNTDLETIIYLHSKDIEITPQNLYASQKLIFDGKGYSNFLKDLINNLNASNDKQLRQLSKEIQRQFLQIEDLDQKSVKNQFKSIVDLMKQLDDLIDRKEIVDYKLLDSLNNLRSSIEILKSANEHINYYNIPMMLNNEETSMDIYVYKDGKRNKRVDPSNLNIMIALDLKYIGHIESLINIMYKNMKITFKTENKTVSKLINKYSNELIDYLEERGYKVQVSAEEINEEKINLIYFEDKLNINENHLSSIDVRL